MARIPTTLQAAYTPNPNAVKFICNNYLIDPAKTAEFDSIEEAKGKSKLAEGLFGFSYVTRVFIASTFVTVTKNESTSWDYVLTEIRDYIRNYVAEGNVPVINIPEEAPYRPKGKEMINEPSEYDDQIRALMKEFIEPTVAQDGGEIIFLNYKDGIVTVRLKGACHQCPASNQTLKNGIETVLKRHIPDVVDVVAEQGFLTHNDPEEDFDY